MPLRIVAAFVLSWTVIATAQEWKPAPMRLATHWAEDVSPEFAWPEYPRPAMVRDSWMSLNGLWEFAITKSPDMPDVLKRQILVPFPVESALSGIGERVAPDDRLFYRRLFKLPATWPKDARILLHFEAVDWKTTVFLNGHEVGTHTGGYDPFTIDITKSVLRNDDNDLTVRVTDPTTAGGQPVGKQTLRPEGIWYTPSSGIWQSVWIEPVADVHIVRYFTVTKGKSGAAELFVDVAGEMKAAQIRADVRIPRTGPGAAVLTSDQKPIGQPLSLAFKDVEPRLWSPSDPYLYDLSITVLDESGKELDVVRGYFGWREIVVVKEKDQAPRMVLNPGTPAAVDFQFGPLDQGFWPDGLYTPPSDAAMKFDLEMTKKMGFNMLRKHVKVENRRFYTHCDRMGIIVWQDMPNGRNETAGDRENFEIELERMIVEHKNHPSIVMWVPFNEGWGQYDTPRVVEFVKKLDPTRLVNNASGWTDAGVGDVLDIHVYPGPGAPKMQEARVPVLGEYGGLGYFVKGHTWSKEHWGYQSFEEKSDYLARYEELSDELWALRKKNLLAAAIYTQTTDVESEVNGLLTYDRHEEKIESIYAANAAAGRTPPRPVSSVRIFIDAMDVGLQTTLPGAEIRYTLDGTKPTRESTLFEKPFKIEASTTVRTKAFWQDGESRMVDYQFTKVTPRPALDPEKTTEILPGIGVLVYDGRYAKMPDLSTMKPVGEKATAKKIDLAVAPREMDFALRFEGFIDVPKTGIYTFFVTSDDGAQLQIDGEIIVDNDGIHGAVEKSAAYPLEKGLHTIRLDYFQGYGGRDLKIEWQGPDLPRGELTEKNLSSK